MISRKNAIFCRKKERQKEREKKKERKKDRERERKKVKRKKDFGVNKISGLTKLVHVLVLGERKR